MSTTSNASPSPSLPPTLRVAAVLLAVEALAVFAMGGWLLFGTIAEDGRALAIGLSSALFIVAAGLGVGLLSYGLFRARSWTRAPVTLAQFLLLPIGWQLIAAPTTLVGFALIVMAIVTLVLMFLPSSIHRLLRTDQSDGDGESKIF